MNHSSETKATLPLTADDPRLPAVRARLFVLIRSLWKAGVLGLPLSLMASDRPALALLPPLWQRLRVELLGETLLEQVIPPIEQQMASSGRLDHRASPLPPAAPVDWPATWRRNLTPDPATPLVTRRWQRELDLPENQLARYALAQLTYPLPDEMRLLPTERSYLTQIRSKAAAVLVRPAWQQISLLSTPPSMAVIQERVARRPAYHPLLAWWRQWQAWRQPAEGTHPLLDPALEPKWLYELTVLFELVSELARHYPTRQARTLADSSRTPAFVSQTPQGPLLLYYQTSIPLLPQRSLDNIVGIPDLVLQLPGAPTRFVILDAKNFGPAAHTQALYKLLGYLYQFGYAPDGGHYFQQVLAGVLAFPTEEREGTGLRNWQKELPMAQAVLSFVLPPLPDEGYTGMTEFVQWLQGKIDL